MSTESRRFFEYRRRDDQFDGFGVVEELHDGQRTFYRCEKNELLWEEFEPDEVEKNELNRLADKGFEGESIEINLDTLR